MGKQSLVELSRETLSENDKRRIEYDIIASIAALGALAAGFIYQKVFPDKSAVAAMIYLVGILIEGVPIAVTAIKGFLSRNMSHAMEILVAIAIAACFFNKQFVLAILIPVILNVESVCATIKSGNCSAKSATCINKCLRIFVSINNTCNGSCIVEFCKD